MLAKERQRRPSCVGLRTSLSNLCKAEIPGTVVAGTETGYMAVLGAQKPDGGRLHHERVAECRAQSHRRIRRNRELQLAVFGRYRKSGPGFGARVCARQSFQLR